MTFRRRARPTGPHEHKHIGEVAGGVRLRVCQDCGTLEISVVDGNGTIAYQTTVYRENVADLITHLTVQYRNFVGPRMMPMEDVGHVVS